LLGEHRSVDDVEEPTLKAKGLLAGIALVRASLSTIHDLVGIAQRGAARSGVRNVSPPIAGVRQMMPMFIRVPHR
jgi:hypothetical protein